MRLSGFLCLYSLIRERHGKCNRYFEDRFHDRHRRQAVNYLVNRPFSPYNIEPNGESQFAAVGGNRFRRLKKLIQKQRKDFRMDTHFAAQSGRVKVWFTRRLRFVACVSGLFVLFTLPVAAQTNPLVVSTVAAWPILAARMALVRRRNSFCPAGVAVDGAGNVYVADADNDTIRKVTSAGVVSTLAGMEQVSGTNDGTGSAAQV